MTMEERIAKIMTPEFLEANQDLDTIDKLYAKVAEVDPGITYEDFEAFAKKLSEYMHADELGEEDLETVAGGFGWLAAFGVVAAVGAGLTILYKGGKAVGQAIYYMTH